MSTVILHTPLHMAVIIKKWKCLFMIIATNFFTETLGQGYLEGFNSLVAMRNNLPII